MAKEELLQHCIERAQAWLSPEYDEATRQEVQALLDAEDKSPLIDAFYKDLEFGTGGIRGIMGAGANRMNRYTVGKAAQGLANYMRKVFGKEAELKVAIGYDCRHNSQRFAQITAGIMASEGIKVYLYSELRPTPMISYAVRELGCQSGVMITASHNPKIYNGFKAYWEDGAQMIAPHDVGVINEVDAIHSVGEIHFDGPKELITMLGKEMDDKFIKRVLECRIDPEVIRKHHDLKIVFTPMHGTSGTVMPRMLAEAGFTEVHPVPEQMVQSGDFPTAASPNPEDPVALEMALALAKKIDADILVATDPDGDRIGTAAKDQHGEWQLINGNQSCLLFAYYAITRLKELGKLDGKQYIVKTIVTTDLIQTIAERNGVKMYDTYTGFKWIADVIRKEEGKLQYIGGGEESYGYLWSDFVRDKCSVSATLIFAEITAWAKEQGLTIPELLDRIYTEYGYSFEKNISVVRPGQSGAEEIKAMMEQFRAKPFGELAGAKVTQVLDFSTLQGHCTESGKTFELHQPTTSNVLQYKAADGTKLSIRPSGTEPKIKFYIEVHAPVAQAADLPKAKAEVAERIQQIQHQLGL